ncbi:MAG: T9SS type A sorting domain-containing protein [Bacteroidetes bacterium]|nr:T9SS type A sorting domain-containing protein [Bacteroidota bacterium]
MKKLISILTASVLATAAYAAEIVVTEGVIEASETWTNDNVYVLDGFVAINNGVVLTIEPGTIVRGNKATKGTLIIMRGGQLIADGTACEPIVFTSNEPVGTRNYGDWGGIIMLGRAPINVAGGFNTIEGGVPSSLIGKTTGSIITEVNRYGGPTSGDNSGIMRYVRIEYPGIPFSLDNEINGLTMGGVGNGTILDYIQVSFCGDDAFEWFGGTVNAKHLIAYNSLDDDWDSELGYSGKVQYGVARRDPAIADISSSNGWETDNDATGSLNSPRTNGTFANFTHIGPIQNPGDVINSLYQRGGHLRRSSQTDIYNSIITGYPVGVRVDGATTSADYEGGALNLRNNIWAGHTTAYSCTNCVGTIATQMAAEGNVDLGAAGIGIIGLTDPYNAFSPNFQPAPGSLPLTLPDFDGLDPFFDAVEYIGAFDGTNDWTASWAEWNPNSVDYGTLASINYNPTVTGVPTASTGCANGSVNITPAGGRGAYSYLWSNGATTQDISGLAPGAYSVTVSSNGCTVSDIYNVVNSLAAPTSQSHTVLSNRIQLNWVPTAGAVACNVQGQRLPTGPSPSVNVTTSPFNTTNVPFAVAGAGTTWTWRVRCACSITPLVVSAFTTFGDTFSIPVAREGEIVSIETTVFPNPASDMAIVSFNAQNAGMATFNVVDMTGKLVASKQADVIIGANAVDFNVADLTAGVYMIEILQGQVSETVSLIVE